MRLLQTAAHIAPPYQYCLHYLNNTDECAHFDLRNLKMLTILKTLMYLEILLSYDYPNHKHT